MSNLYNNSRRTGQIQTRPGTVLYSRAKQVEKPVPVKEPAPTGATIDELLAALEALPARKPISLQVVAMVDDPNVSASQLAGMVAADAALTTRLLRIGNSAYYGLSGRVSTVQYAITVLGFSTVRAMALADAVGMHEDDAAPEGFWERAAVVGVASSIAARWTGARAPEALCAGLLHDLGKVLLYRVDPEGYSEVLRTHRDGEELLAEERRLYRTDHAAAAAKVLAAWSLPEDLVRVVRTHHDNLGTRANPAERSLAIGRVLADTIETGKLNETALREASGGKVTKDQAEGVLADLRAEAAALTKALTETD